jgi:hypothetical protein
MCWPGIVPSLSWLGLLRGMSDVWLSRFVVACVFRQLVTAIVTGRGGGRGFTVPRQGTALQSLSFMNLGGFDLEIGWGFDQLPAQQQATVILLRRPPAVMLLH